MELTVAIFAVVGAVLNRFSGWTDYLPGRNIHWATLAAFLLAWPTIGATWAGAIATSMLTYRLPGWSHALDLGTRGDTVARDFKVMFVRSLCVAPVFVYAFVLQHDIKIMLALVLGALGATLAYWFGNHILASKMKDPFWFIESAAGAALGGAIGYAYVMAV